MAKIVELRRHTANDGDVLTDEGIEAAVAIGAQLDATYDLLVSSGAQRATQTLACFLAASGRKQPAGVEIAPAFLVAAKAETMGEALRGIFERLPDGGRALVVGHSPMHETAIYGLTGSIVEPLSKGAGVLVIEEDGSYRVEPA